jgi:hypothetical protein
MKRFILVIAICSLAATVFAVPYASQIKVSSSYFIIGMTQKITYFVNEAGGSATINIVKASDESVVATFAGTANLGTNTVNWNGRIDNASGAYVPDGNYKVKVTINASKAPGWVEIASNSSVADYVPTTIATTYQTLFDGFSGSDIMIDLNPAHDRFGIVMTPSCYTHATLTSHYGYVWFNPDTSTYFGGDGSATKMNISWTPDGAANQALWGGDYDPDDPDYIWVAGQDDLHALSYGKYDAASVSDATLDDTLDAGETPGPAGPLLYARSIAVHKEGSIKYGYICLGSSQILRCVLSGGVLQASPAPVNIAGFTDTARYGKNLEFDKNGNLYFASRYNNSSTDEGGAVYRWDAAQVASATAGSLTEANASWDIQFPTGALAVMGVAIGVDGSVYADCAGGGTGVKGIYLLGNISQATNKKTLAAGDLKVAYHADLIPSYYGHGLAIDYAGNLYLTNRADEEIRVFGPQGTTSVAVVAPDSQEFYFTSHYTAARGDWALYD